MNNTTFVHKYIRPLISKEDTVVDMTAGGGSDTLFLAAHAGHVYAFDIDPDAIARTREKTKDFANITYILDSHVRVQAYTDDVKLVLFNLGYYPYGDRKRPTEALNTILAVDRSYEILKDGGYLILTFYRGHPGGKDEYIRVMDHIQKKGYPLLTQYQKHRHEEEPVTVIIKKT